MGFRLMNIGIIGTGNIANFLLEAIKGHQLQNDKITIASIYGRNTAKGKEISEKFRVDFYNDIDEFLKSGIDTVVEAATVQAVKELGEKVLHAGKNLVISSVGAMADETFYQAMEELAVSNNVHIYIPSGAIGGIDAMKAANALGELKEVSLTTRKPPQSLGITDRLQKEKIIYEGSAQAAIQEFPKNINVSIVLSLAGLGSEHTKVKIIADPNITKNTHTIEVSGEFGAFQFVVENASMPNNPKTSYLAALSILSLLNNMDKHIQIGG